MERQADLVAARRIDREATTFHQHPPLEGEAPDGRLAVLDHLVHGELVQELGET